jgi:putative acetyltransferase
MSVREELPTDRDQVGELHLRAFGDHGVVVARLVDQLRLDDPDAFGLVWEEDGAVVGHVMFTRSLLDAPERLIDVQVLSPLGVLPEWQGRGIGSALIAAGIKAVDDRGAPLLFLEGDPAYYVRAGFEPGHKYGFRKPSLRISDAAFQVVKLSAYRPGMTGTLVYLHTFWDLDCVGLR